MSFFTVTSYNIKEFVFTFLILSSRKTIEIYLKLTIIFILIQLKVFKQNSDYYSILWVEHTRTLDFNLRFSVWLGSNTAASYFSSGIDICIFLFYSMSVIILRDIIIVNRITTVNTEFIWCYTIICSSKVITLSLKFYLIQFIIALFRSISNSWISATKI